MNSSTTKTAGAFVRTTMLESSYIRVKQDVPERMSKVCDWCQGTGFDVRLANRLECGSGPVPMDSPAGEAMLRSYVVTLTGLHLLLTWECTMECDHCFVWGIPRARGTVAVQALCTPSRYDIMGLL